MAKDSGVAGFIIGCSVIGGIGFGLWMNNVGAGMFSTIIFVRLFTWWNE